MVHICISYLGNIFLAAYNVDLNCSLGNFFALPVATCHKVTSNVTSDMTALKARWAVVMGS